MTSTATVTASVTSNQSLSLIRNMLRLNMSSILYQRGCLPEGDFETRDVNGLRVQSISHEGASPAAKTICQWLEQGVFQALTKCYLEKAIICISKDEDARQVLEAWVLSVEWMEDEDGIERPNVRFGKEGCESTVALAHRSRYTMSYVRNASQVSLRQLTQTLESLPSLPTSHYVSMRILYRDHVTPAEYQPTGFEAAKGGGGICFDSKPLQLSVAQPVATDHQVLRTHVVSCTLEDNANEPTGLAYTNDSWRLDLTQTSASAAVEDPFDPDAEASQHESQQSGSDSGSASPARRPLESTSITPATRKAPAGTPARGKARGHPYQKEEAGKENGRGMARRKVSATAHTVPSSSPAPPAARAPTTPGRSLVDRMRRGA